MHRALIAVALCVATVLVSADVGRAQTPAGLGFTFEPASAAGTPTARSFFDYTLAPGDAIQDYVRLVNLTDHERTFAVYAADAYATQQGSFALRLRDQERRGVGAWVSLPFTTRSVPAGTAITFPFQLGIPRDAAPGDWAGGVVASAVDDAATRVAGSGVRVEAGVAARVYVRVQGPLHPALSVTRLEAHVSGGTWAPIGTASRASVSYDVVNSGNVRLAGTAELQIIDAFGRVVSTTGPRQLPELLPGDAATLTEQFDGLPLTGMRYRARVVLAAPDVHTTLESSAVWHASIPLVAMLLVLLAAVVLVARWVVRVVSRRRTNAKQLVPA